jgi:TctA family transporter
MPEIVKLILYIILLLPLAVLPVVALIDVIKNKFESPNGKLKWVLLIIFTGFIGSVIYYLTGVNDKVGS